MKGSTPVERSAALGRVLADAERAGWAGDSQRARRLLRLGERLARAGELADVLVAAESVRTAAAERKASRSDGSPAASVRLPRLRPPQEQGVLFPPMAAAESPVPAAAGVRTGASTPRRRRRGRRWIVLVLGVAILGAGGLPSVRIHAARAAGHLGQPCVATAILGRARTAEELLVRGDARLAVGDSVSAAVDFVNAAREAKPRGEAAWIAGERLRRIPGQEAAAAEAYLRAYVLGVGPERWETIADALDRADRTSEAERVRSGTGR